MATGKLKKTGLEVCKYTIANQNIPSGGSSNRVGLHLTTAKNKNAVQWFSAMSSA